jgi:hypothetical protein
MRFCISIMMLYIAVAFASCRKDTSGSQPMLVQSIGIDSNQCPINFTYDAQNRLTSIIQCDTSETYTYSHDSVIDIKMMINEDVLLYKNTYLLNTAGLAKGYFKLGGDGSVAAYVLTYDAAGHRLSSIDTMHVNTSDIYVVQNNDIISEQSTSSVTGVSFFLNTTYYPNTINRISNVNFGLTFLGASSADLKRTDSYAGLSTMNYTYQLDVNNGISQRTTTINGVVTEVRNYTYY